MAHTRDGQIALPFVLLVGGIILEIVIAGAFVSYFANGSGYSARLEVRAWAVANSAVNDALVKIAKNKEFTSSEMIYPFLLGTDSATVTVSRVSDGSGHYYVYTVDALGTAGARQRKLEAVAIVNQTTGALQLQSLNDVPLQ